MVDVINLEVPGSHVKALTSAATLIKELQFSKRIFDHKRAVKKTTPAVKKSKKGEEVI